MEVVAADTSQEVSSDTSLLKGPPCISHGFILENVSS